MIFDHVSREKLHGFVNIVDLLAHFLHLACHLHHFALAIMNITHSLMSNDVSENSVKLHHSFEPFVLSIVQHFLEVLVSEVFDKQQRVLVSLHDALLRHLTNDSVHETVEIESFVV